MQTSLGLAVILGYIICHKYNNVHNWCQCMHMNRDYLKWHRPISISVDALHCCAIYLNCCHHDLPTSRIDLGTDSDSAPISVDQNCIWSNERSVIDLSAISDQPYQLLRRMPQKHTTTGGTKQWSHTVAAIKFCGTSRGRATAPKHTLSVRSGRRGPACGLTMPPHTP